MHAISDLCVFGAVDEVRDLLGVLLKIIKFICIKQIDWNSPLQVVHQLKRGVFPAHAGMNRAIASACSRTITRTNGALVLILFLMHTSEPTDKWSSDQRARRVPLSLFPGRDS